METQEADGILGDTGRDELEYPRLVRRYLVTFLDAWFVFSIFLLLIYALPGSEVAWLRVGIIATIVLFYEPVFTSRSCTLGQKLLGVRVRRSDDLSPISIFQAYARLVVKFLLGWISFLSLAFNYERRAIHDFAVGSVVIRVP